MLVKVLVISCYVILDDFYLLVYLLYIWENVDLI